MFYHVVVLSRGRGVFHGFRLALEDVGEGFRTDGDGASHELRNVIALNRLAMIVRIGTRQFERLCAVSVLVDMSDERTGILAIVAAAAEDDPFAIA